MRTLDGAILGALLLAGCQRTAPEPSAAPVATQDGTIREVTRVSYGQEGTPREVLALIAELQRVSFAGGSAGLGPTTKDALTRAAHLLRAHPLLRVELEGHDDEGATSGRALGRDRAHAVRGYLEARGIGSDRVAVVDFGATEPRRGRAKRVWSLNRRMEFVVLWGQELALDRAAPGH